ncbi:vam6/Vps39-like protein isoform X2 [Ruditapes philippinarum]|uniref:vam6/Vps39-like protein isoform X2 n=1 Tax=Ruditapes philippinarum TaxID=129788 RepID=UPI00295ACDE0|nr:vam6/Vps39-like protein isoform X2 [Ruditapes philippinarum]
MSGSTAKMDAYEYETVKCFKKLGCTVECITAYDDTLLVAVKGDQLLRYKVVYIYDINKNKQKVRVKDPDVYKVFGKPVSKMHPVPEFSLLLAVYDNMLNVHDLETFKSKNMPLLNTRGMNVMAVTVQNEKDSSGIYGTNLKVCVAVGKKLLILEWTGDSFIELKYDLMMDKYVKDMVWCKKCLYIGYKDEYLLLEPETGKYKEVFNFGNSLKEPLMTKIDDDYILLGYDNTSVFLNSRAKPKNETITWTGIPHHMAFDPPYVLAVLPKYMEVRTFDPSISIQQIEMKHVNAVCKARNVIFLLCRDDVFMLTLRPIDERVNCLLKNKHFQVAKQLKLQDNNITMEEKELAINSIQARYAVHLFNTNKFKEALEIFTQLEIDPSHIIGMFPDLLPSKLSNSLVYPEKVQSIHEKALDKALFELVEYLQTKREQIVKAEHFRPFVPIMKHKKNVTLKSVDEALSVIDTTLLKCYLQVNEAMIAQLLRMPGNKVQFEVAEKRLKAAENFAELIILYEQQDLQEKALQVMKSQSSNSKSSLYGLQPTIHQLQQLGKDHLGLIFEYAKWVMETDPYEGIKIFTEDTTSVQELPRGHVSSFIKTYGSEVLILYLEHIIYMWNDTTEELHYTLANELRNMVSEQFKTSALVHIKDTQHVPAGQEEGELGLYRGKFLKFLKTSNVYNPEDILRRLPFDSFFEERAILLGKMGRHEQALGIFVYVLENLNDAEECI